MTLADLARRARTSSATLYGQFGGKEGLFLATFDTIGERSLAVCMEAYGDGEGWPGKMHAMNHRLFGYLSAEPGFARTALVDVLGAGPPAPEHRAEALEPFRQLPAGGYDLEPQAPRRRSSIGERSTTATSPGRRRFSSQRPSRVSAVGFPSGKPNPSAPGHTQDEPLGTDRR